jgi:hypothetical protein
MYVGRSVDVVAFDTLHFMDIDFNFTVGKIMFPTHAANTPELSFNCCQLAIPCWSFLMNRSLMTSHRPYLLTVRRKQDLSRYVTARCMGHEGITADESENCM